ncbi:MAG TPA: flagellar basal body rod protein FlgB [Rhodocyclaceae bacterium]|jgi:flagellar basal-body rod protein FlgB|nr:flagellar basal body rod protein FlgB [Betaproteobacteria bacterium]HMV00719.1 flagellar basal body rod protein FlgB [Rhodocyclaceae bacterium]HMV19817.1 flagellar basal body rod protein FlgB [Rhodocyclaceae bacterium]HMW76418.1 flagellar basal body rod protein FlgB [Rhodocyclaceae bacterium]HNE41970.1 flagellar basal body rod protein FlgB [Rhodocyclaceae bacterium]
MHSIAADLSLLSTAIGLRAERHQVLAANVANADTPQYKARDFDFRAAMSQAMAGRGAGALSLTTTTAGHLKSAGGSSQVNLAYRSETQSAVDGNTVDMDVERGQMAENALQYDVLTRLMSDKIQGLKAALITQS